EPAASYMIDVFSDTGPGGDLAQIVKTINVQGNTPAGTVVRIDGVQFRGAGQYLFLRIRQIGEHGEIDRAWTAPVWFESSDISKPPQAANVRIAALLPNPAGDDVQNEAATLINRGTQAVSMVGWHLRDLAHQEWVLDSLGTPQPGESKTIRREGQPMTLN